MKKGELKFYSDLSAGKRMNAIAITRSREFNSRINPTLTFGATNLIKLRKFPRIETNHTAKLRRCSRINQTNLCGHALWCRTRYKNLSVVKIQADLSVR